MPDLRAYFRSVPAIEFSGIVYRICPFQYAANLVSMRGAFLHGARYNIRGYFGALYTSLSKETAAREMARDIGLRAWENGIEAMLVPSVAHPAECNLAGFWIIGVGIGGTRG